MKSAQSQEILIILIKIFTPGPLTLPVKFSWRVLTSWILTGWILGLLAMLMAFINGGIPDPGMAISVILFMFPIALLTYGLIGLGIDLIRGKKLSQIGWVWYFYPLTSAVFFAIGILIFIVSLCGVKGPKERQARIRYDKLLQDLIKTRTQEFLEFSQRFIQDCESQNLFKPEEKMIVDNIKDLSNTNPNTPLGKLLSERELHIVTQAILVPLYQDFGYDVYNIPSSVL